MTTMDDRAPDFTKVEGGLFLARMAREMAETRLREGRLAPDVVLIVTRPPPDVDEPDPIPSLLLLPASDFEDDGVYDWAEHLAAAREYARLRDALGAVVVAIGKQVPRSPGDGPPPAEPPPGATPVLMVSMQHAAQGRVTRVWTATLSAFPGDQEGPVTVTGDWVDLGAWPVTGDYAFGDILFDVAHAN